MTACLTPLRPLTGPDLSILLAACRTRATMLADAVTAHEAEHPCYDRGATTLERVAQRIAWDVPAAGEFPRPLLADVLDLVELAPAWAAHVWHHAAGVLIVGRSDCCPGTPAGHGDALTALARMLADQ